MDGSSPTGGEGRTAAASARAVAVYYLFKATEAVEFYRPIMYLHVLSAGLSFTHVAILEALYNLTTVLGEVPTGYVGDRIGRRASLFVGSTVVSLTLVGIGLAASFPAFAVLFVAWSLGYNFRSGTEDAWVYETLTDAGATEAFARVRGRGQSIALAVGVGAALAGGFLAGYDLSYPFFAAAALTGVGAIVLLALEEPDSYEASDADDLAPREALSIVRETVSRPRLRSFVAYYFVLFSAVTYLVFIFLQPVFVAVLEDLDPALALSVAIPGFDSPIELAVGADDAESLLGAYYAAISLASAAISYRLGAIRDRVGIERWFLAVPIAIGLGLVAMVAYPPLALVSLFCCRVVVEPTRVLAGQYVNDRIETLGRATVLSAMAMVSALTVVPFQLASGALSDVASPLVALAVAGGVLVVGSIGLLAWESPMGAESASPTGGE